MAKLSKKISLHQRIGSLIKRLNNGEQLSTEDVEQQYETSKRNAERDFTERLPKYLGEPLLKDKSTKKWFLEKSKNNILLNEEEELTLNLLIEQRTPLGFIVTINNEHEGLLYHNEIYEDLFEGQETVGYVKKIRGKRRRKR